MRSPQDLIREATEARTHAYAPYSGYQVGAAVESDCGNVFTGCNVENVSYGATLCAERNAIASMVSFGERTLAQVALVTKDAGLPCGICLQVMLEFAPDPSQLLVHMGDPQGYRFTKTLADLLPFGFRSDQVGRTDG
jgi:cytidine deaminase